MRGNLEVIDKVTAFQQKRQSISVAHELSSISQIKITEKRNSISSELDWCNEMQVKRTVVVFLKS